MLSTSIVDVAVRSGGLRTPSQSPSKGCCQDKEWVLWILVGSVDSWGNWWVPAAQAFSRAAIQNHKLGYGRGLGSPWRRTTIREKHYYNSSIQWKRGAVHLDWESPQSHWQAFHRGSRGWRFRDWTYSSLKMKSLRLQFKSLNVLTVTPLQHQVAVRDSAYGLADWLLPNGLSWTQKQTTPHASEHKCLISNSNQDTTLKSSSNKKCSTRGRKDQLKGTQQRSELDAGELNCRLDDLSGGERAKNKR